MPKRTVLETIVLHREGKRLVVSPQKPPVAFEFTAEEVKQINATNPHAFRKPIDESGAVADETPAKPSGDAEKSAGATPAAASNTSGVNSASGAADLANANKAPGDKPAGTSADKVADL